MDIHVGPGTASDTERAAVDAALGAPTSRWQGGDRSDTVNEHLAEGGHAARAQRHLLLPALHAINDAVGWISEGALNYVCERLTIPPAEAYGIASFYHMFSLKPRPKRVVYVCDDIACMCAGAEDLCADLERDVAREGEPFATGETAWVRSPCLGLCDRAPAALLSISGDKPAQQTILNAVPKAIVEAASSAGPRMNEGHSARPASSNALRRAIDLGRERVIEEIIASKLMGRGGAAFPTGRKWAAVAGEPARPHYLVCNADESEPGTFKDLALMQDRSTAIVEAMTIAAYAAQCDRGYLYIRGEYGRAADAMRAAIEQAREAGALGKNIFGYGFDFDIDIRRGAGAYICGEETALFNSIEGYRGEPRNKPPFPVRSGLFGKPTIVNNVETLVNVPDIIMHGGAEYAKVGTPESTGMRWFCLSGCVARPGVYEVPFGTTLRALIDKAGGVRDGRKLQAVLLGGAAGAFLTPDEIDVPLSFEGVRAVKATLGSGVVMLFDDRIDLRKIIARIARFFRDESCGQCVPCRVGTVRQEELLERVSHRRPMGSLAVERALLGEIGQAMRDASICGLGQTASSAIESALAKFDLYGAASA